MKYCVKLIIVRFVWRLRGGVRAVLRQAYAVPVQKFYYSTTVECDTRIILLPMFDWLKAIHIVFIVSWFAALFYIVRLFVYTAEAQHREQAARDILTPQLLLMQKRLWNIIGWPAMVGTLATGAWMVMLNFDYYMSQTWMLLKLGSVVLLLGYHFACTRMIADQQKGVFRYSSFALRLFNEIATVLLVAIVFLVVMKSTKGLAYGVAGLIALGVTLALSARLYKNARKRKNN
jgi:protoporphyrinogen IX oxidase